MGEDAVEVAAIQRAAYGGDSTRDPEKDVRFLLSSLVEAERRGWLAAADWLTEYGGVEGLLFAEQMRTRPAHA